MRVRDCSIARREFHHNETLRLSREPAEGRSYEQRTKPGTSVRHPAREAFETNSIVSGLFFSCAQHRDTNTLTRSLPQTATLSRASSLSIRYSRSSCVSKPASERYAKPFPATSDSRLRYSPAPLDWVATLLASPIKYALLRCHLESPQVRGQTAHAGGVSKKLKRAG